MYNYATLVADATETERSVFYKKTYTHLAFAILAFVVIEGLLLKFVPEKYQIMFLEQLTATPALWLGVLGVFWLLSTMSNKMAFAPSKGSQYVGLIIYILAEALIFMPLLYIATRLIPEGGQIIQQAAVITLAMFVGLTALVFMTQKDFSFLRSALIIGGFISLGLIAAGSLFGGFNLGLWFSVGMVVLASGSILYQTSQIKYHFETDQYVGAALKLFAAVMLLFWYVIRILMRFAKRD